MENSKIESKNTKEGLEVNGDIFPFITRQNDWLLISYVSKETWFKTFVMEITHWINTSKDTVRRLIHELFRYIELKEKIPLQKSETTLLELEPTNLWGFHRTRAFFPNTRKSSSDYLAIIRFNPSEYDMIKEPIKDTFGPTLVVGDRDTAKCCICFSEKCFNTQTLAISANMMISMEVKYEKDEEKGIRKITPSLFGIFPHACVYSPLEQKGKLKCPVYLVQKRIPFLTKNQNSKCIICHRAWEKSVHNDEYLLCTECNTLIKNYHKNIEKLPNNIVLSDVLLLELYKEAFFVLSFFDCNFYIVSEVINEYLDTLSENDRPDKDLIFLANEFLKRSNSNNENKSNENNLQQNRYLFAFHGIGFMLNLNCSFDNLFRIASVMVPIAGYGLHSEENLKKIMFICERFHFLASNDINDRRKALKMDFVFPEGIDEDYLKNHTFGVFKTKEV